MMSVGGGYKVLYIDVDAHQGNGVERDWGDSYEVFILDLYSEGIYPNDRCV